MVEVEKQVLERDSKSARATAFLINPPIFQLPHFGLTSSRRAQWPESIGSLSLEHISLGDNMCFGDNGVVLRHFARK